MVGSVEAPRLQWLHFHLTSEGAQREADGTWKKQQAQNKADLEMYTGHDYSL